MNTGKNPEPSEAGNEQNDDTSRQSVVTAETNATETFATIQSGSEDIRDETKLTKVKKDFQVQQIADNTLEKRRLSEEELTGWLTQ